MICVNGKMFMCELGSVFMGSVPFGTMTFLVRIGFVFSRDCLEWFHLGLLIGPTGSAFEEATNQNRTRGDATVPNRSG